MTAWSVVTSDDPWYFHPDLPRVRGIRATRQVSPTRGDFGQFTFFPQTGPLILDASTRASAYRLDQSILSPHRLQIEFLRSRTKVELVPHERTALVRFTFLDAGITRVVFEAAHGSVTFDETSHSLRVLSTAAPLNAVPDWGAYGIVTWSQTPKSWGQEGNYGWVEFDGPRGLVVEAKIGTSFIDETHARWAMDRELGEHTLESLSSEGEEVWNRLLGRMTIEDQSDEKCRTFYSCLYRCLVSPRKIHEFDQSGAQVYRNPYTGKQGSGEFCMDVSAEGLYRTIFPLYVFAYRDKWPALLEGVTEGLLAGEPAPWPTLSAVLADALAHDLPGLDWAGVWNRVKDAVLCLSLGTPPYDAYCGKGFVPHEAGNPSVSQSLRYVYSDWCWSCIAKKAEDFDNFHVLENRSRSWQRLFDDTIGFLRPKRANSEWQEGFNPLVWGDGFLLGSAWQGGWDIPHDLEGLQLALGGSEVTLARLDTLLALKPFYQINGARGECREMTEMAVTSFGQYAHGIAAAHSIPWIYTLAGNPEKTFKLLSAVAEKLYSPGLGGFPGDEKEGDLSGWYIWVTLGLYPLCPGRNEYVLSDPLLQKASIHNGLGNSLNIVHPNPPNENPRKSRRMLGNIVLRDHWVSRADLFELGQLVTVEET